MAARKKTRLVAPEKKKRSSPALSLKIEATDLKNPNVDAEDFLKTAETWLHALKVFASEQGERVKWEIVDLRKSSALIEVQPVKVRNGRPAATLVRNWEDGIRRIEKTGRPASKFTHESLSALQDFVLSVPPDAVVSIGNGLPSSRLQVTALTQRRVEEAVQRLLHEEPRKDYVAHGSIRGRLAILDSWNPEERSFRLQLPLAPLKPVKCTYSDSALLEELEKGFEGTIEVAGALHYKSGESWPYAANVERIRVLPSTPTSSLKDLVGLIRLPNHLDSVAYIRSVRDAE
jgi:hypothetical protein